MNLEEIIKYKSGFVFKHKLTNRIFKKSAIQSVIKKYTERVTNPYCKSSITRELEIIYTGDVIRQDKKEFFIKSENKPNEFIERFTALLEPIPASFMRTDDNGRQKPHNTSCEFAQDDCNCWCSGKYHGIRL